MDSRKRTVKLAIDAALAALLVASLATGHAEVHLHAALGLLFAACLVAHGVVSHRKIVRTTRRVACKGMATSSRVDCCLGLAMAALLVVALASGGSLMRARMAAGLSFEEAAATPAFAVHVASSALLVACAFAHVWINRARLGKLLYEGRDAGDEGENANADQDRK